MDKRAPVPRSLGQPAELKMGFQADEEATQRLSLAVSTRVDDFKGAATEQMADAFMDILEQEFGKLTRLKRKFEQCGILHEQIPGQVSCTQDRYVKQLRLIPMEHAGAMQDEVSEPVKYSFWSFLGGAAWTVMTRRDIIIYIGFLQRHQKAPTWRHVKHLNTVVRWMIRNLAFW